MFFKFKYAILSTNSKNCNIDYVYFKYCEYRITFVYSKNLLNEIEMAPVFGLGNYYF